MVKDHSDSERGNLLLPHGLLFPISSKSSFICTIPQTGQHIPQPLLHQSWNTGWNENQLNGQHHEQMLSPQSYISLPCPKQIRIPQQSMECPFCRFVFFLYIWLSIYLFQSWKEILQTKHPPRLRRTPELPEKLQNRLENDSIVIEVLIQETGVRITFIIKLLFCFSFYKMKGFTF